MPRPEQPQGIDHLPRTVLIDNVGQNNDEGPLLQVRGYELKRPCVRGLDQFRLHVVQCLEHGVHVLNPAFRRQIFANTPTEDDDAGIRPPSHRRTSVQALHGSRVEFCLALDPAGHHSSGVDGDHHRLVAFDLILPRGEFRSACCRRPRYAAAHRRGRNRIDSNSRPSPRRVRRWTAMNDWFPRL